MERVICPICGRNYLNFNVYRKHAKKKHNTEFERKKPGPARSFMPDAPDEVRKKAMARKFQDKNQGKRNREERELRLACHVIKYSNQRDDDLLTLLSQTSQAIVDEYIASEDNITLQLAGYQLLHLDWKSYADISLLWPHGHGMLSPDPPDSFYNPPKSHSKPVAQRRKQAIESRQKKTAIKKYHTYISNAIPTLLESFTANKGREKPHVRKYRILAHCYLLRHSQYLPEVRRIPSNIIAKARLRNARRPKNSANAMDVDNDDADSNDNDDDDADSNDNDDDDADSNDNDDDDNNINNSSGDTQVDSNTHATATYTIYGTIPH
ncbi:hypothetical protein BDF22DRAFT_776502 [Syncephalis plumigaleata]|nr:hypothetical protein BDF22DRAFT_776502 [Syncephalis plumigaleata]